MAFTYDLTTAVGKVRLEIPDKTASSYELEDAEIEYYLTGRGQNVKAAAADCCDALARQYAQTGNFSADGLSLDGSARAEAYAARAKELRRGSGMSVATVTKSDGYADAASDPDYDSRIVYVTL